MLRRNYYYYWNQLRINLGWVVVLGNFFSIVRITIKIVIIQVVKEAK
jgi:hypothetical protein